jgi:hypothetical protein
MLAASKSASINYMEPYIPYDNHVTAFRDISLAKG